MLDPASEYKMKEYKIDIDPNSRFMKEHITKQYDENQMAAIVGAVFEDVLPFTLIQGPPGTGKTHTILGILNMCHIVEYDKYLNRMDAKILKEMGNMGLQDIQWPPKPKFMVCAPSNSATDGILLKVLKHGFLGLNMSKYNPKIVRIGFHSNTDAARDVGLAAKVNSYISKSYEEVINKIETLKNRITTSTDRISRIQDRWRENRSLRKDQVRVRVIREEVIKRHKHHMELTRYKLVQLVHQGTRSGHSDLEASFLDEAAVIFTTVSGCKESILQNLSYREFELLITDEAAQVHEAGVLPALSIHAARYILVGDPNQLPATLTSQIAKQLLYDRSLFERLQSGGYPSHMLQTQYRMHSHISRFPSEHFYMGQLKDSEVTQVLGDKPYLKPYRFYDVFDGVEQYLPGSKSPYNDKETFFCYSLYENLQRGIKLHGEKDEIRVGIITPYTCQAQHLKRHFMAKLNNEEFGKLSIDTIDAFQGQEREVIILSCVRTNGLGFVGDQRRMNVGLTRAKRALWVCHSY